MRAKLLHIQESFSLKDKRGAPLFNYSDSSGKNKTASTCRLNAVRGVDA